MWEERTTVFEVLNELNRTLEVQKMAVRGMGWEEYASPGVSTDPQALINAQLLKEYDILIALFGASLGTPTKTARSGTVEELERAISFTDSPFKEFRAQVYFKDRVDNLSAVSVEQLTDVMRFRGELGNRGVLYSVFTNKNDLAREVRVNINRAIQAYGAHGATSELDQRSPSKPLEKIESLGFLDYMESAELSIEAALRATQDMSTQIEEIGKETNRQVEIIEKSAAASAAVRKRDINNFAAFLSARSTSLRQSALTTSENFKTFIESGIAVFSMAKEVGVDKRTAEQKELFLEQLKGLIKIVIASRESMRGFKASASAIPRITSEFNKAKRELIEALDLCLQTLEDVEQNAMRFAAET
jgi:hypothetical protein